MEEVFSYRVTKDGKVFISWYGKQVVILSGKRASAFVAAISIADNEDDEQLIMAKVTGNFKRGNEKIAKRGLKGGS